MLEHIKSLWELFKIFAYSEKIILYTHTHSCAEYADDWSMKVCCMDMNHMHALISFMYFFTLHCAEHIMVSH